MHHSRTVKVNKSQLIETLEKNKAAHIKEYEEAVIAYREEATKELARLSVKLSEGKLNLKLDLVTPVNKSDEYDKVIEMFNWEVEDQVELTQGEFNEYVHDEMPFAKAAKFSNATYLGK